MAKTPILKKDLERLREEWLTSSLTNLSVSFDEVYEYVITKEDLETLRRGETADLVPFEFNFDGKTAKEIRDYFLENFDDNTTIHLQAKIEEDLECDFEDDLTKPFDKYFTIVTRPETYQEYIDRLFDIFYKHSETLTLKNILYKEQLQRKQEIEKQMASLQSELDSINKTIA